MNQAQAIDLANVIHHLRPDWQQPGIVAALKQADGTYPALCLHAIRTALNPASHTPGAILAAPVIDTSPDRKRADRLAAQDVAAQARRLCSACDDAGYRNGHICDHEPARPSRNAELRAMARANVRPTITFGTEETTDA